jgi:hypothetical protein
MREVIRTARFKRDVKLAEKRGKDMAIFTWSVPACTLICLECGTARRNFP